LLNPKKLRKLNKKKSHQFQKEI